MYGRKGRISSYRIRIPIEVCSLSDWHVAFSEPGIYGIPRPLVVMPSVSAISFVKVCFRSAHDEDTAGLFREGGQCFVYDLLCLGCKQFFRVAGSRVEMRVFSSPFGMILQVFAGIFP